MEGLATSAERDSIKYMQVKYMQDHKIKSFRVISGVTEWGIYVEIMKINVRMVRIRDDIKTIIIRSMKTICIGWSNFKSVITIR
jgi:exoribonuclease R